MEVSSEIKKLKKKLQYLNWQNAEQYFWVLKANEYKANMSKAGYCPLRKKKKSSSSEQIAESPLLEPVV